MGIGLGEPSFGATKNATIGPGDVTKEAGMEETFVACASCALGPGCCPTVTTPEELLRQSRGGGGFVQRFHLGGLIQTSGGGGLRIHKRCHGCGAWLHSNAMA